MGEPISLTREQYLDSIRQICDTATELTERFNMAQLTWQPGGGERWSILECLDHLTVFTGPYLDAIELSASNAGAGPNAGVLRTAGFPSAEFTRFAEPPPRAKFRAPGKLRPRPTLKPEGILPNFISTMDRVSAFVISSARKDLNTARFRNPFIPGIRFTAATGLLVTAAHCRRHLWQAEQVTYEPDFPR